MPAACYGIVAAVHVQKLLVARGVVLSSHRRVQKVVVLHSLTTHISVGA